jgi:hypothetical protein
VQLDTHVTSGLDGGEWPVSRHGHFTSIEYEAGRASEAFFKYGRAEEYLGSVKNRTVVPRASVPCPSHSTDCTTQARPAKCYESKYYYLVVVVVVVVVVVMTTAKQRTLFHSTLSNVRIWKVACNNLNVN